MALIIPNDKKFSHKRKNFKSVLWTIAKKDIQGFRAKAPSLPFSLCCRPERSSESSLELRKIFRFFFNGVSRPKRNFFTWFVSHLPMMAWKADFLPGTLSIFFLTKEGFEYSEAILLDGVKQFLLANPDIRMLSISHRGFSIDSFSKERFIAGKIKFLVETKRGIREVKRALPFLRRPTWTTFLAANSKSER